VKKHPSGYPGGEKIGKFYLTTPHRVKWTKESYIPERVEYFL
jgi:hypothetical protein